MMVLISVILTGLVMTIAWAAGVQAQIAGASIHTDQALLAAESAGQWAVWKFKQDNSWRQTTVPTTLPTLAIGPNTFTYSLTCLDAGSAATLYWPFSEGSGTTTADASGHGNTGQLVGGVSWTTGKFGKALAFDGSTGYVDAGHGSSTNIVGSVTMAAWVKMNSAGQDQKVGGNQDGNIGGYKMSIYGLRAEFEVRDASNTANLNRSVAGGTILTMGVWYHVTGVYNAQGNSIKTYINGVLDRDLEGVESNALASTTGDFIMGREPWTNVTATRFFNGSLDEVRVYNRALSDQEIKTLADTSVHIHATATQQTSGTGAMAASSTVDFLCSSPAPMPPIAPALTVGGNLPMNKLTVSGDVQVTGNVSGVAASAVNGHLTYSGTYTDTSHYITVTLNGKSSTATQNAGNTVPAISYASIQAQASSTVTGGSNQTFSFTPQYNGQAAVIYVNGNVTDPVIDTSQIGGTLLINGTLTLTKNASWGSSGFPAYVVVESNMSQSAGTLTLSGGLYVGGNWTHRDSTITGDVCVTGNITDNTATASTIVVGGIPWFDPRSNAPTITQPLYYTSYEGGQP